MQIRIGTRKSLLAIAQANIVAETLKKLNLGIETEIIEIITTGDKLYNANLALIGGKGLFLKEIEEQLLLGNIDIAVHSMKDVPNIIPDELHINCVLEREDARDVYISANYKTLKDLKKGAIIGTSSTRRKEQLLSIRSDLNIIPFRGNINTRINKMKNGEVDAILLAFAGLKRTSMEDQINEILSLDMMIPAVCQGIICVESRKSDINILNLLNKINHFPTFILSRCERAFMLSLGGDCTTPIAANATFINNDQLLINAGCFDNNSGKFIKINLKGSVNAPELLGISAAENIKSLINII